MICRPPSYPLFPYTTLFRSGIGRLFDLGPIGLVKLAAFFATLKLAVACICALHIADRARCFMRGRPKDRKSTRLNSSHVEISYAVFCLTKKLCLMYCSAF